MELEKQSEVVDDLFDKALANVEAEESEAEAGAEDKETETTEATEETQEESTEETQEESNEETQEEVSQEEKKEKAFASISKKLQESNRKGRERDAEIESLKAKLAKYESKETESNTQELSEEAQAELDKAKSEREAANAELKKYRLEDGVKKLISLGGDEKMILKFLENSEKETGIDFRENPNSDLMVKHFKALNADALIKASVQEKLKAKKETAVQVEPAVNQSQPKEDSFAKDMIAIAKDSSFFG